MIVLPATRPRELCLFGIDMALLLVTTLLMIGFTSLVDPYATLHEGMLLALNITLAFGFGFNLEYLDLSGGRYSLGKAALMGFAVWMMDSTVFWLMAADVPWLSLLISAWLIGIASLLSGVLHYRLSEPFMKKKPDSFYYRVEQVLKRAFDFTTCALGLLALSPLMLMVLALICLESKGSPIFTQMRIGLGEVRFRMYKFRSMRKEAPQMAIEKKALLFKREDDPRVTRVGRLIRKLSIDELPQLVNVLKGEMSLVGPRPPLENEFEMMNWHHRRKFEATPGLTGLWQIIGRVRNQRDFNSVAAYDIYYIENWCLMQDLEILLKTIPVVLLQKGAC